MNQPSKTSEEIFFRHPEFEIHDWLDFIASLELEAPQLAAELRSFVHEMKQVPLGELALTKPVDGAGLGSDQELLSNLRIAAGIAPPAKIQPECLEPSLPLASESLTASDGTLLTGRAGNDYLLVRRIGIGAHGTVYLARQSKPFKRYLAVKIYHAEMQGAAHEESPTLLARLPEILALSRLRHPGIGRIFDAGLTPWNQPFVVMEYIEGCPLTKYASSESLSLEQRIHLFQELVEILQHAHDQGIYHLDVKPTNTVVQTGVRKVRVIDFSIAHFGSAPGKNSTTQGEGNTAPGRGTIGYRSPEQAGILQAAVDHRSDIFACGCVLAELLCDEKALPIRKATEREAETKAFYEKRQAQIGEALIETPKPFLAAISKKSRMNLSRIAKLCLAYHPQDRYQSLSELNQDLTQWLAASVSGAQSERSRKTFVLLMGATLIAAATLAWAAISHRSSLIRAEAVRSQVNISVNGLAAELTNEFTRRWNMPSMSTPIAKKEKQQLQLIDALFARLDGCDSESRANILEKMLDQTFFAGNFASCGGIAEAALARFQVNAATRNLRATAANYLLTTDVSGDSVREHLEAASGILSEFNNPGNTWTAHGNLLLARISHVLLTSGRDDDREIALQQLQTVLDNSDGFLREANAHSLMVMNTIIAWHLAQRRPTEALRFAELVYETPNVLEQAAQDGPLRFAILRATALQESKQIAEAHRCLDEAIERTEKLPPTWYGALFVKKAELFEMQGNLNDAYVLLSDHHTLETPKRSIDAYWAFMGNLQLGRVLVKQKSFSEAIPALNHAVGLYKHWRAVVPTDAPVFSHIWCAEAHAGAGDTKTAIEHFRAALSEFNHLRDQGHSPGVIAVSIGKRIEEKIAALQMELERFKAE